MVPDTGRVLIRHFRPHVIAIIASSSSETIRLASFPTHIEKTIPGTSLADPVVDFFTILPDFHPVSVIAMFNALEQERTLPYPMLAFFFSTAYLVEGIVGERHGFDLGMDFLAGMEFEGG